MILNNSFYIIIMKSNKIPCTNISTESYTGKEQSPKRFGLSAEGFDINFEKEGYDNQIWSVQIRNGRKVWAKKNNMSKITHEVPLLSSIENTNDIPSLVNLNNDDVDVVVTNKSKDNSSETSLDIANEQSKEVKVEKKKTDYNIFIKYYLDKLKSENKDNTPHKILFQAATLEWNRLKKNPQELKTQMDNIKK
jgi:hypothetical protein